MEPVVVEREGAVALAEDIVAARRSPTERPRCFTTGRFFKRWRRKWRRNGRGSRNPPGPPTSGRASVRSWQSGSRSSGVSDARGPGCGWPSIRFFPEQDDLLPRLFVRPAPVDLVIPQDRVG